jgi:hypothetical protein
VRDSSADRRNPGRYQIRVRGHLDARWTTQFDEMTLTTHDNGTTVMEGVVVDQAALHGTLAKLRDVGLPLLSVTQLDAPDAESRRQYTEDAPPRSDTPRRLR